MTTQSCLWSAGSKDPMPVVCALILRSTIPPRTACSLSSSAPLQFAPRPPTSHAASPLGPRSFAQRRRLSHAPHLVPAARNDSPACPHTCLTERDAGGRLCAGAGALLTASRPDAGPKAAPTTTSRRRRIAAAVSRRRQRRPRPPRFARQIAVSVR